jgi:transposase
MASLLVLPDPTVFALERIEVDPHHNTITATATTTAPQACCPRCQQPSHQVQSRYVRTLADLPCSGQRVRWHLQVRRFRCKNGQCPRKIFTERLPTCAPPYARRTVRQAETACEIALAVGGKVGERIVGQLAMPTSQDTLLRLSKRSTPKAIKTPRVLGVDDFAWKKGRRYGTLLIDLETHQVVDLLPDREAETLATWLQAHPGVEVISRDRAGAYAEGASRGAPQAIQVADRFHLLLNLQQALTRLFERNQPLLKRLAQAQEATPSAEPTPAAERGAEVAALKPLTVKEAQRQGRRGRRLERYARVLALHQQGASQVAIAALVGLHRDTVRHYVTVPAFPEIVRPHRGSLLDPYKAYLQEQWAAGQHNATHLFADLRTRGYRGSATLVSTYCRSLREQAGWQHAYQDHKARCTPGPPATALSARAAAWLFAGNPRRLKPRQVRAQDALRRGEDALERAYQLAQDFRTMVTSRQVGVLGRWLEEATRSGLPEFRSLAVGIYRDYEAVYYALALPYSNGQTEAQVHRLKVIKRQAYGRASFALLRLRVLYGSGVTYQQKCA